MKNLLKLLLMSFLMLALVPSGVMANLDSWTIKNPSPTATDFNDLYDDGTTMVAVGDGGSIFYSTGGTSWTKATSGTFANLYGITKGTDSSSNTLYVAVGDTDGTTGYGTILTSYDLSTWTKIDSNVTIKLNDVVYANSMFVAVGGKLSGYGTILTSPYGSTWTSLGSSAVVTANLNAITYASDTFVAVGDTESSGDGVVVISTDGSTWDDKDSSGASNLYDVVYDDEVVAVGANNSGNNVFTSSNKGSTWAVSASSVSGANLLGINEGYSTSTSGETDCDYITTGSLNGVGATFCLNDLGSANNVTSLYNDNIFNAVSYRSSDTMYTLVGENGSIMTASSTSGTKLGVTKWTMRNSSSITTVNWFNDIENFGGNNYIAVGQNGKVFVTADGLDTSSDNDTETFAWYGQESNTTSDLNGVAVESATEFVAVGDDGTVIYTSDGGTTWKVASSGVTTDLNDVTYGGGNYIAIGESGELLISSNQSSWSSSTSSGTSKDLYSVTPGGSGYHFVAVGDDGTAIYTTSSSLSSWTEVTVADSVALNSVAAISQFSDNATYAYEGIGMSAGNTLFIAVGEGGVFYAAMNDPTATWAETDISDYTTNTLRGVAIVPGSTAAAIAAPNFIAVGDSGTVVYGQAIIDSAGYNAAASNVALAASSTPYGLKSVAVNNDFQAAVNAFNSDCTVCSSSNAIAVGEVGIVSNYASGNWFDWSAASGLGYSPLNSLQGIAYSGSQFVAVGYYGTALYNSSGSWMDSTTGSATTFNDVATDGTTFVAVGAAVVDGSNNYPNVYTTTSASNWAPRDVTYANRSLYGVTYGNGAFIAVGRNDSTGAGAIYSSDDSGMSWVSRSFSGDSINDIVYNGTLFCGAGNSGALITSSDGSTWTSQVYGGSETFNGIASDTSGNLVAVGDNGTIIYSSDNGSNWSVKTSNTNKDLHAVTYDDGSNIFVATGENGTVLTSPNGSDWTKRKSNGIGQDLAGITQDDGSTTTFYAVGAEGSVLTSTNAATNQYTLTVATTGTGLITSSPSGIDCGTDCTEQYDEGESVTLTASGAFNSVAWSGCDSGGATNDTTCSVTMDSDHTVNVSFGSGNEVVVTPTPTPDTTPTPTPTTAVDPVPPTSFLGDLTGSGNTNFVGLTSTGMVYYTNDAMDGWAAANGMLRQVIVNDFNGDGKADLIGIGIGNEVWVKLDASSGVASNWKRVGGTDTTLTFLTVGDFDGDGKTDNLAGLGNKIVVGTTTYEGSFVYYSGTGSSWSGVGSPLAICSSIATGDLNGDGRTDLVCADLAGNVYYKTDVSTTSTGWTAMGVGQFKVEFAAKGNMVIGDFNGDGSMDIAGLDANGKIWYTTDKGATDWKSIDYANASLDQLAVGDLNNDGKADLIGVVDSSKTSAYHNVYYTTDVVNATSFTPIPNARCASVSAGDLLGTGTDVALCIGNNDDGTLGTPDDFLYYTNDVSGANSWMPIGSGSVAGF